MKEVRPATVDEMIVAFLRADIETIDPDRRELYAKVLAALGADRATLIHRGDIHDPQQNDARRFVLGVRGYGQKIALFRDFPEDTGWHLFKVTPDEVKGFKYANRLENWARVSGYTRLVADGVKNLNQGGNEKIKGNVTGIANRLRQGERFPPLIAVQQTGIADVVLMEGHNRATAYALTDWPDEIEVIIGTSAHMGDWLFF
jgi:hypothetical protein